MGEDVNAETIEPDFSFIDICVARNGMDVFLIDWSSGFHDWIDGVHFEDNIDGNLPALANGLYRWTDFHVGWWDTDEPMNIKGGTFARYELAAARSADERVREAWEEAAGVADDAHSPERAGQWRAACRYIAAAIRSRAQQVAGDGK